MKNILRIDSSTRMQASHSRGLADSFEAMCREYQMPVSLVHRDLVTTDLPHTSQAFIEAMFTPKEERSSGMNETLALSDTLIAELKMAETIMISVPMFNFTIPSSLKAYIDHISRVGETFTMDESGFTGLLTGKKLVILAAYGADFSQMRGMDFVEPYLKSVFGFLGFEEMHFFALEGTSMLDEVALGEKKRVIEENFSGMFS